MGYEISNNRLVTVFGGSGFIGTYVVQSLAQRGWRMRVAGRRPERAYHLQPLGEVGQIQSVQANVRFPDSLAAAVTGADAIVNLVGILDEHGRQSFDAVNAQGAGAIAEAATRAGARSLVHVSALGADAGALRIMPAARRPAKFWCGGIFLPPCFCGPRSVFGPGDDFLNRFASLARSLPFCPSSAAVGPGSTRSLPAISAKPSRRRSTAPARPGTIYEIGGPKPSAFARSCNSSAPSPADSASS